MSTGQDDTYHPPKAEALVLDLLGKSWEYLCLKDYNRVQALISGDLTGTALKGHPFYEKVHPVQMQGRALTRLQVSTLQAGTGRRYSRDPLCQWRVACGHAAVSGERDRFWDAQAQIWEFFQEHFGGKGLPFLDKLRVRMILREPLGVFAVLAGDTDGIIRATAPENRFYDTGALKPVPDLPFVPELSESLL